MKLQILIPHYHETTEELKPLLDSIALQQNVDFNEIGVVICHDGKDIKDIDLPPYNFKIEQIRQEHKGVSAARNACLDYATADYVMFCDADDMFINMCGLYIVFREMVQGFDTLISVFQEETRNPETKEVVYVNHNMDSTFVHGKIHRRQYLINKHIRWNDNLTIHEDSYFNILCQNLTDSVKYCQISFYLWKWRDASVCRHDPKYILKTYNNMLDSNDALIDEFLSRGLMDKAMFYAVMMIFDAYYTMNKPEWINQDNKNYRDRTERRFSDYFKKHEDLWAALPITDKMNISNQVRSRSINEGMQMEAITIDNWLKKIKKMR
ncbi:MAG: glycosyltransferase family 2 protein [Mogibacterium sp.]|nr:glycosyltransferase family 2 protein [Mogibacterium sp.]